MDEIELRGNSYKQQEKEEAPIRKVTTSGKVVQKKQSSGKKILNAFISEDVGSIKEYVIFSVLIPALKDMVSTGINAATDMFLYNGEVRGHKHIVGSSGRTNYNVISSNNTVKAGNIKDRYEIDDIYFEERMDAIDVLDAICDYLDEYGRVSVYHLYDACGKSCDYTMRNWGWYDLNTAQVVHTRDGLYKIKLPKIVSIK